MSTLVVVGYDEPFKADEVLLKLRKLQREYLLDLEDAAVAIKDEHGKVKLHQTLNLTAAGAASGGFWGTLIGLIFLNPLLGFVIAVTCYGEKVRPAEGVAYGVIVLSVILFNVMNPALKDPFADKEPALAE